MRLIAKAITRIALTNTTTTTTTTTTATATTMTTTTATIFQSYEGICHPTDLQKVISAELPANTEGNRGRTLLAQTLISASNPPALVN